jgi:hypothetical protein
MVDSELFNPDPEDFAAAELSIGPLPEETGSPVEARVRYEIAQAHKLVRMLKDTAQRIREDRAAAQKHSNRKKPSRR